MSSKDNKISYGSDNYDIISNIRKGQIMSSGEDEDLIQAHLPYIKESNVVNIYELFTLDSI